MSNLDNLILPYEQYLKYDTMYIIRLPILNTHNRKLINYIRFTEINDKIIYNAVSYYTGSIWFKQSNSLVNAKKTLDSYLLSCGAKLLSEEEAAKYRVLL